MSRIYSLSRLLGTVRPHAGRLAAAIASGMLHHALVIAGAGISAWLAGSVARGSGADLRPALWLLAAVVVGRAAAAWAEMWLAHDVAYRLLAEMRKSIYDAVERLAPGYLATHRSGDLASAAMADVACVEWFYAHTLGTFAAAVVVPAAALATLAWIHPSPALALLPLVLLVAVVPFILARRAARQGEALRERYAGVNADVIDGIQGLREIVSFGQGASWLARLRRRSRELVGAQLAYGRRAGAESAATSSLTSTGLLCVLGVAASLTANGSLPAERFPVTILLAGAIFGPILAATAVAGRMGLVFASADRVFELLEAPAPVADRAAAPPAAPPAPHVRFDRVGFRYEAGLPRALDGVSFEARPGETVALVGHSGAGKSTCIQLLLRFWDVEEGAITIGGRDLRDLPQEALRDLISLVPQDIYLFHESVRENIRLGRPEASGAEVEAAARAASAHDFITGLPEGYDTVAGEDGTQLSGGQRQRIAIARALLKGSPILVMDEAVSSLDSESEREIQRALPGLRSGRTSLIVAHRLSTILAADRVVVLERGRAVETGTHAELLARGGAYARLIASQRDGVVPEQATGEAPADAQA